MTSTSEPPQGETAADRVDESALPTLIVGAGLSGLACALTLHQAGIPVRLFEASDGVGGRVRTDKVDGFLLDRGFQVYLDAYPEAAKILDLKSLNLCSFEPGALVFDGAKLNRVMDVFRRPSSVMESALAPIGTFMDKIRVALLRFRALGSEVAEIHSRPDHGTTSFLQKFGFSQRMIDGFFRPFYGGIFLENDLRTSSRMFEFTFKMFSEGSATLPAVGMGAIPLQLAKRLPSETIQIHSAVASVTPDSLTFPSGEVIKGHEVVIATQAPQTARLVPGFAPREPDWKSVTNVYFSADKSPFNEGIIALNATGKGLVNNICAPSDIAASYAPDGQSLISVSLLGCHRNPEIPATIKEELSSWFGEQVAGWNHLRTDVIKHALPEQKPGKEPAGHLQIDGIHICGDHTTSSSIEGAIISGLRTAEAIISKRKPQPASRNFEKSS
ncbi:FAD-dependent oxidoreductase [Akkermansiaceae bacterium]|nr:FAD-dependent oxidoreductase [Akkermansiaceae bacterium]MDB4537805.1 FAD-dependent oxidoreductase [Akkermansiaceae bacterium]